LPEGRITFSSDGSIFTDDVSLTIISTTKLPLYIFSLSALSCDTLTGCCPNSFAIKFLGARNEQHLLWGDLGNSLLTFVGRRANLGAIRPLSKPQMPLFPPNHWKTILSTLHILLNRAYVGFGVDRSGAGCYVTMLNKKKGM